MDYFICKQADGSHTLAKFEGNDHIVTYTIKGKSCDCPAGLHRGRCKHIQMIADWKEGYYYEGNTLLPLSFTEPLQPEDLELDV